ncbi:MAG: cell division protein FtsQ/DivIB [Tannerellaceae bacterium]|nr:cell division protein FtsQ/DivIB [Tannerellaceae bacterium]
MPRIIAVIASLCLLAYIVIATVFLKKAEREETCLEMQTVIRSRNDKPLISEADIVASLKKADLYPVGKSLSLVNTDRIELEVMRIGLLSDVEAYKTPANIVKLSVTEKVPILRVMTSGSDYYVDRDGGMMPANPKYATYVPLAAGYVEKSLATSDLYEFALYLQEHDFWNNQIEQIYIRPDGEVELVPRAGNHRIILGRFERFEEKLNHLKLFYEQAIPKMGWEKYSNINLKYKNQIVCTKK